MIRGLRLLLVAAAGASALLTGACMKAPAPAIASPPSPTVTATVTATGTPAAAPTTVLPADWRRCTNEVAGYSIGYPAGWYTTQIRPSEICYQFHPSAFTIPVAGEYPLTALNSAKVARWPSRPDPTFERTLLWEETTVQGRDARRYETSSTGQGLHGAGTRQYGYVIRVDDLFISVFTTAAPAESRMPAWKTVVDQAATTVAST